MKPQTITVYWKLVVLATLLLFTNLQLSAQIDKRNTRWYFGENTGLDFNTASPTLITDSKMFSLEACASIADEEGHTLFYTNGVTVWNKLNEVMENGSDLDGDLSTSQVAIIPSSGNDKHYFIFTVGLRGFGGDLKYSVVNMAANGGVGRIEQKNLLLASGFTEKLTSIKHANGSDIWLVAHEGETNRFFAWLLTANGVIGSPVISSVGLQHGQSNVSYIGYLKASPNGSKLAIAGNNANGGFVESFDFDNSSGAVTNPATLTGFKDGTVPYGLEFSTDNRLLYITEFESTGVGNLYQVKLPFTSGAIASKGIVLTSLIGIGALQIAPDRKIYLIQSNADALHAINFPNVEGLGALFQKDAVLLTQRVRSVGLPPSIQSPFSAVSFIDNAACSGSPTTFRLFVSDPTYESVTWDFNDPSSGADNISNDSDPSHIFARGGTYLVKVTIVKDGVQTDHTQQVTIPQQPDDNRLVVQDQKILCEDGRATLAAQGAIDGELYAWYDAGQNFLVKTHDPFVTPVISNNTSYYVSLINGTCESAKKKIDLIRDRSSAAVTPIDATVDIGNSVTLTASEGVKYEWSPALYLSSTDTKTTVSTPKKSITYQVKVTSPGGCVTSANVHITLNSHLNIPNTFTPNNDGINDVWAIKNIDLVENLTQVFNRNGSRVYSMQNYSGNWNGTTNGKPLPSGTYYYIIKLFDNTLLSGSLTIIR